MSNPEHASEVPRERPGFNPEMEVNALKTMKPADIAVKLDGYNVTELSIIEKTLQLQSAAASNQRSALQEQIYQEIFERATPIPMPVLTPSPDAPKMAPMPMITASDKMTYL